MLANAVSRCTALSADTKDYQISARIATPWNRILHASQQLLRFLNKCSAFYRTPRFITVCTTAHARPYVKNIILPKKLR
jgi:hypothetical protein